MKNRFLLGLLCCFLGLFFYLFRAVYNEAKEKAIADLNAQQTIHAKQAQRGIEGFFDHTIEFLTQLAGLEHIIDLDDQGRNELDLALHMHPTGIHAIARIDRTGKIAYISPSPLALIDQDISPQKHIRKIMETRLPVISGIFTAVEGHRAMALHVPVLKGTEFRGTLGVLVDFHYIAENFLEVIRYGQTGYAWMTNQEGIELYCPVPGHTGNSVFENCKDFPTILSLAWEMVKGRQGMAVYEFDRIREERRESVKKHAVYMPIKVADSFWSIVVATSEDEVLASLVRLRNRLIVLFGLVLAFGAFFFHYSMKAWGIVREAEKRKGAEKALREAEAKYRIIIDAVEEGICLQDAIGKIVAWNRGAERIFGITSEQALGKTSVGVDWRTIYEDGSEFRGEDHPSMISLRTGNPCRNVAMGIRRSDGEIRWIKVNTQALIRENENKPHAVAVSFSDVTDLKGVERELREAQGKLEKNIAELIRSNESLTAEIVERKRAEEALRTSEAQLANAVEIGRLAYWEYDVANDLFLFNDQFYALFRTCAEKVGGYAMSSARYAALFVHPEDNAVIGEEIRKAIEASDANFSRQIEHRIVYADGQTGFINVRFFIVKDDRGVTVKTCGANQDITERKAVEKEKEILERQLQQTQKMEAIGTLAGGIAHDFNNILTPIMVQTELAILAIAPDHPAQGSLKEVLKAAHRAKKLVGQIVAFSRQSEHKTVPLDIIPIVKEALQLIRSSIPTTIDIQQQIKIDSAAVEGDSTQIHQLVLNLCANAAHAMRENGGILHVSVEGADIDSEAESERLGLEPGQYVRVSISDTGHGIKPSALYRIFEPFYTTKVRGEGTGMGLAVVHGIVKSYGGTILVDSQPGQGTRFEVFLPRTKKKVVRKSEKPSGLPSGNERVLLVDDEKPMVDAVRSMLNHLGYEVVAKTSSVEALECFRAHPENFDIVITDMTMPNMTGRELATGIISIRPDIPVILCTGFSDQINADMARQIGVREFVMKPIIMKEMAETIRDVLDNS